MAYTLFGKTEIASYTDVAALFCVVQEDSEASVFWKYQLYGNLCWEYKTNTLYHCGKYDHLSYVEFENEDRITLVKLPKNITCNELKKYFDKGFFVLLPINTRILGYTNASYIHNVFVTGYQENEFIVYDFWTPSFTWKYERIDCKILFESVDFTNNETVQMIYAFKYNDEACQKYNDKPNLRDLNVLYTKIWDCNFNKYYNNYRNAYGYEAYRAMCEHIKSIDIPTLTDSQNIHIILDHLQFTKKSLNELIGERQIILELNAKFEELIDHTIRIRAAFYKYYISKRDIGKIRDVLIEEVNNIAETEKMLLGRIIEMCGEGNAVR